MTRFRYALAAVLLLCVAALPSISFALPINAKAIIFFDTNDNIIGNSNMYCNNVREHAGQVDYANPNRVEFEYGCGDPIVSCDTMGVCKTVGHNNINSVFYFQTATGRTIDNYCRDATYIGGPFFNKKPCGTPGPTELSGLGPYSPGLGF